jgi:hypothetical protein
MDLPHSTMRNMIDIDLGLHDKTTLCDVLMVEEKEKHPEKDCHGYVFGSSFPETRRDGEGFYGYEEIRAPEDGDIILYFMKTIDFVHDAVRLNLRHSAICVGNSRARSKWGYEGDVYEHPIHAVPAIYGNEILFFRRIRWQGGA